MGQKQLLSLFFFFSLIESGSWKSLTRCPKLSESINTLMRVFTEVMRFIQRQTMTKCGVHQRQANHSLSLSWDIPASDQTQISETCWIPIEKASILVPRGNISHQTANVANNKWMLIRGQVAGCLRSYANTSHSSWLGKLFGWKRISCIFRNVFFE